VFGLGMVSKQQDSEKNRISISRGMLFFSSRLAVRIGEEAAGDWLPPGSSFYSSLGFYGLRPLCSADLRLAIDEIVHHDDVMVLIVIRTRYIAGRDPDRGDAGVIKLDAEKGLISIARRGWNETAE
jgi:hypothetical protein